MTKCKIVNLHYTEGHSLRNTPVKLKLLNETKENLFYSIFTNHLSPLICFYLMDISLFFLINYSYFSILTMTR